MKWKMAENSLFAILLRSSWWISAAVGVAFVLAAQAILPAKYFIVGAFGALPFFLIAGIAGWRQFKAPSPKKVAQALEAAGAMSWAEFSSVLEAGLRSDGYTVEKIDGGADFLTVKAGRTAVVAARRWKGAKLGLEPLRELEAARQKRDTHDAVFVTIGEVTERAAQFARGNGIRMLAGADLAKLVDAGRLGVRH
ncbi:restriction endonuclease [Burkholderiaceae bacterium FT117]|uniref:restriction endonuclease n=1 Tax=Zeimonas sediminis TaxID=2944268 RepID=UPI002342F729|nr:restriction endonuclease [Zeimonas sediminis]MCM5571257.1 restriction endonuclease [Zeimonas sediminis]